MERNVLLICSVVGFLGILSAVTGFAAEATRIKVFIGLNTNFCVCIAAAAAACICFNLLNICLIFVPVIICS